MTQSDNTAANLLLATIGGPAGLTAFARKLGDQITRLDRIEPDLNEALPGDLRDATTPKAKRSDLGKLVLGDALLPSSKTRLTEWTIDNKTGGKRLRAGLPPEWKAGDKTGSGERHKRTTSRSSGRLTVAVLDGDQRNLTMAEVGQQNPAAVGR